MLSAQSLPTAFACNMAESVSLLPKEEGGTYWNDKKILAEFQGISLNSSLDAALTAYHGKTLTKVQKDMLQIIHKFTKDWILGQVTAELMEKLSANSTSGKDAAAIGTILNHMLNPEGSDGGGDAPKKGLTIKITGPAKL